MQVVLAVVTILSLFLAQTCRCCSIPDNYRYYDVTERSILAPIVVKALVLSTSASDEFKRFQTYEACFQILEVLKGHEFNIPNTSCIWTFGPQSLCLSHVFDHVTYYLFLNEDLSARYDNYHGAATNVRAVPRKALEEGVCKGREANCFPPRISDQVKDLIRVNESTSLRLGCEASGTVPFVTTWQVDAHDITPPARILSNGDIFIENLTPSLRGLYTCTVHNPAGSVSKNISVEVIQSPCGAFRKIDRKGIMQSPLYPSPYPQDKMCVWRICPPKGRRLLIHFLDFDLRNLDAVAILNECEPTGVPWRRYCGNAVPKSFVTRCRGTCVQISLSSANFYNSGARGIRFSYEPTTEKRTRFRVKELFCQSDFIIHARVEDLFNRHVVVDVKENFKGDIPVESSPSGAAQVKLFHVDPFTDAYGCRLYMHYAEEFFFAGTIRDGVATIVHTFTESNKEQMPQNMIRLLKKYKEKNPKCTAA